VLGVADGVHLGQEWQLSKGRPARTQQSAHEQQAYNRTLLCNLTNRITAGLKDASLPFTA
jgi:hypothetical protein